jgi:hypothetical protein
MSFHGLGQKKKIPSNCAIARLKVHQQKAMQVSAISNDAITRTIAINRAQESKKDNGGAELL